MSIMKLITDDSKVIRGRFVKVGVRHGISLSEVDRISHLSNYSFSDKLKEIMKLNKEECLKLLSEYKELEDNLLFIEHTITDRYIGIIIEFFLDLVTRKPIHWKQVREYIKQTDTL